MPMSEFRVYSSSAGSGKTYTLTREYLRLILSQRNAFYFKKVLAITFTNDAASEMKKRILGDLLAFSQPNFNEKSEGWGKFAEIAEAIRTDSPEVSDEELMERASNVFRLIIHEYSDFSVRTIDSFVNKLVSAFTDELGLPFNYEIVMDRDGVLLEAVERLFEKAGNEEFRDITRSLKNFALSKAEDGKSWNDMPAELARFGANLLNDLYYPLISKLADLEPSDFYQFRAKSLAFIQQYEQYISGIGSEAANLIAQTGLQFDDFAQKAKGIGGYFQKLPTEPHTLPNAYHRKAIEADEWYSKRTDLSISAKIDCIKDQLRAYYVQIETYRTENDAKYQLLKLILPSFYKLSLLKRIKEEFDAVLLEKNQVFISEFNRKILGIVLSEPIPFIYERLGEKFNHILIDEFQDTSDLQFYNLLPLIENALAGNYFNLLVGDAKQSIYRWRGGKMELIVHLFNKSIEKLLENPIVSVYQVEQFQTINRHLNPQALTTNYRSATEIIAFNNEFFEVLLNQKSAEFPLLKDAYADFRQVARNNAPLGGHIAFSILESEEKEQVTMQEVASIIKKSLAEGYESADIAVLCRTNKESSSVANYLIDNGFEVISQDSLLLKSSGLVRLTIAFLKVIDQPDNKLVKYEAAYLFFQFLLHQIPDTTQNQLISKVVEAENIDEFYQFFSERGYHFDAFELQKSGVYAITEKVMLQLRVFAHTNELTYLFGLLDLALEYGNRQSNHLHDFLLYWEDKKEHISVNNSAEKTAITVTTIHKSKGLEYPIVIIPFAHWAYQPKRGADVWFDLDELDYEEMEVETTEAIKRLRAAQFSPSEKLEKTPLKEQYLKEIEATFIENLNLLYVGFTRPTDKLYVLMNRSKKSNKLEGVAEWMESFLLEKALPVPDAGNVVIFEGKCLKEKKTIAPKEVLRLENVISCDRGDRLRLRRTSEKVFDPETLEKTKDKGNKIHATFALMKSAADLDMAINQLVYEGVMAISETAEIKRYMQEVMDLPELKPLFIQGLEVANEKEILVNGKDFFRPDRVIFLESEVVIIDYKTGQKQESHVSQIRNYGRLYQQMGYENVALKIVYLETKEVLNVG